MQFLQDNPDATKEEFDAFMVGTYGEGVLEELYGPQIDSNTTSSEGGDGAPSSKKNDTAPKDQLSAEQTPEGDTSKIDISAVSPFDLKRVNNNVDLILSARNGELSFLGDMRKFIILGVEHILGGLDHILFVLSIVLVFLPWRKIFEMITAFTVAHSLTLILAGTGILVLSGKIVEPIIAFSIAYMAITTVFLRDIPFFQKIHNKIMVIFIFGLFHGLGFAGALTDLQIPKKYYIPSLLSFNVGVEIGQVIILLVALPLLFLLRKNKTLAEIGTKIIAGIISALALFWVLERIFY
ncbi:HupE/UreJ family protein [Candidatus Peregrinibacteria bacterium]|nr:MAG: HupE/UreJ family protein [Candidatus Peregrinibacteria bacterium]